jgi:hypothetical protein
MNPVRKPLILRVVVVIFAVSLVSSYVVYSQTRTKPQLAGGTKSKRVLEDFRQVQTSAPRQEIKLVNPKVDIAALSTKSGAPLISPSRFSGTNAPGSKDVVPVIPQSMIFPQATPKLEQRAVQSIAPGSKSLVPVFRVQPPANNPAQRQQQQAR